MSEHVILACTTFSSCGTTTVYEGRFTRIFAVRRVEGARPQRSDRQGNGRCMIRTLPAIIAVTVTVGGHGRAILKNTALRAAFPVDSDGEGRARRG
eukprot:3757272-Rhodomonas_salina.3